MAVPFTKRETEIFKLILDEHTSQEIADQLGISARTVETHRKNIIKKSGTKSLVGLVKYGFRKKMIR